LAPTASATSERGLGTYLLTANSQMNTAGVYGAMLLLTAIGIGSFLLVLVAEHFATPWRSRMTAPAYFGGSVPIPPTPQPGAPQPAAPQPAAPQPAASPPNLTAQQKV
jgi:hypothetical protein